MSGTTIWVDARVEPDGRLDHARVVGYEGRVGVPSLDKAAIAAAMKYEFLPAHVNGTPVPIIVRIEIAFMSPTNQ